MRSVSEINADLDYFNDAILLLNESGPYLVRTGVEVAVEFTVFFLGDTENVAQVLDDRRFPSLGDTMPRIAIRKGQCSEFL